MSEQIKITDSEKELVKSQLGMLARKVLILVAGWLLARAGINVLPFIQPLLNQTTEVLGGIILTGLGTVWAFRKQLHLNRKIEVARTTPEILTRKEVEQKAKG
jgi:hypothetical protein